MDDKVFGSMMLTPDPLFRQKYDPHEHPLPVYQGKEVHHPEDKGFPTFSAFDSLPR